MDIEKAREAATAHYEGLAEDRKKAARDFFEAMDTDKSGDVSIDEFMAFLSDAEFQIDNHEWIFEKLDEDDNGTLDFEELVTFFYIISRDEYKNQSNSRASTDAPRTKARSRRQTRGVNNQGQRRNWVEFFHRYNKLQPAAQALGQSLADLVTAAANSGCHIV